MKTPIIIATLIGAQFTFAQGVAPTAPTPPVAPAPPAPPAPFRNLSRGDRDDRTYDSATKALDARRYDEAIRLFDQVAGSKSPRSDGALYWKAYALNRAGRREEALATLTVLRRDYASSRWLNDAQALEAELKQGTGQAMSPADEANEDLKLMAINGLMSADPERAVPLLEGILKGTATAAVKDRAMFVLTQSRSPRAQQVLTDYAKGGSNPDLQLRALRYIGMSGTSDAVTQLTSVYNASNDTVVKREIIRSLMVAKAGDALLNIAKTEKNVDLKTEAIRNLGVTRANAPGLVTLYNSELDKGIRMEIARGLFAGGDAKSLVEIARKESDPTQKKEIVRLLTMMKSKDATDFLMELLK